MMTLVERLMQFLGRLLKWDMTSTDSISTIPDPPIVPASPPETLIRPVQPVSTPISVNIPLDFSTPKAAYHSTRVLCDEMELTLEQKNILCACVYQESNFLTHPRPNQNKDPKTGQVWSTDYGIIQINDHFHIGPGKDFPSVQYVLDNPDKCIRWMVGIYKNTGTLQPWSSFSTGAYKKWLIPTSPMWLLKVV